MNASIIMKRYYRRRRNGMNVPRGLVMMEFADNLVRMGWSLCDKEDTFTKRSATSLAIKRRDDAAFVSYTDLIEQIVSMPHSLRAIAAEMLTRGVRRVIYARTHNKANI